MPVVLLVLRDSPTVLKFVVVVVAVVKSVVLVVVQVVKEVVVPLKLLRLLVPVILY